MRKEGRAWEEDSQGLLYIITSLHSPDTKVIQGVSVFHVTRTHDVFAANAMQASYIHWELELDMSMSMQVVARVYGVVTGKVLNF